MDPAKSTRPPHKNAAPGGGPQTQPKSSGGENEGEGNRTAARRYDEALGRFIRSGGVEAAAREAERALDGSEGDELREAEDEARATQPEAVERAEREED